VKTNRLPRRLSLDQNPLRRRSDNMAVGAAALLLAAFLIGAPLLSAAAAGWAGRAGAAEQQAERSWRQVSAVLLQPVPASAASDGFSRVLARWTAPDGQTLVGRIPVSTGLAAGRNVPLWVNAAGSPAGTPLSHRAVVANQAIAAITATVTLGILLLCLAWGGRRVLDRRRLADWGTAWAAAGPQWTKCMPRG
jgi:hypothetical protein